MALSAVAGCSPGSSVVGTTDGGLHYEASGAGEAVILIHAFSLDRRMWDGQIPALERRHRVVRYDLRGHGLSAEPSAPYTAHEDLLGVYEAAGIRSATLVGLSAGAEIAVDFALEHPQRVTGLVLAAPGLGGYTPTGSFDWFGPVGRALQEGDAEEATRRWVETPLMRLPDAEAASAMREIAMDNWRVWTFSREHQQRLDPPAIGRLAEISAPTLVLVGDRDLPDTQRVADLLTDEIAGARKIVIPGAGHLVNLAQPGRFNDAVLGFLDQ